MKKILILHGWGSCAKNWKKVKEILESKRIEVILPDLPGFGKNQKVNSPLTTLDYVDWVKRFIKEKLNSNFFLLGHSFGGKIAVNIMAQMPEKVCGLILVAPAIFATKKTMKRKILKFFAKKYHSILKPFLKIKILQKIFNFSRKILYIYLLKNPYYLKLTPPMKKTFENVNKEDFSHLLPKIKCKSLLIFGKNDSLIPLREINLIKEQIPNCELKILPRVGHSPNLQIPEKLAKMIIEFIKYEKKE